MLIGGTAVAVVRRTARDRREPRALGLRRPPRRRRAHAGHAPSRGDARRRRASTGWPDARPVDPRRLLLLAGSVHVPGRRASSPRCRRRPSRPPGHRRARRRRRGRPGGNRLVLDDQRRRRRRGRRARRWRGVEVRTRRLAGLPADRPAATSSPAASATSSTSSAGKPALERLQELAGAASRRATASCSQRGLHLGLVVDEHQADFEPGRLPRPQRARRRPRDRARSPSATRSRSGQTVQFHVRDAGAADEDLRELLAGDDARGGARCSPATGAAATSSASPTTTPAWSTSCSARCPLAGMFCAGELGPVGGRNFLHGFTASLALFA